MNFHKTLGGLCLGHFIYRFLLVGDRDMDFGPSLSTPLWIGIHALLSASALIFKIPTKRILEGSRIWPEYRLHSIAFAYRSLACMLLIWVEDYYRTQNGGKLEGAPNFYWNVLIVMGTLVAADAGTWWVGKKSRSSTINDLKAPLAMKYFFSVMQFHATMNCLIGVRRYATQFIYVWIIQFTAFILTLRRKNLVPHTPSMVFYGIMLSFGFCVNFYDLRTENSFLMANTLANLAAFLRLGCRMPKYLLWALMSVLAHFARLTTGLDKSSAMGRSGGKFWTDMGEIWFPLYAVSVCLVIALGVMKVAYKKMPYSSVKKTT
uniref:Uncharacterized protein n=1 Tax=Lotharella oceanica TaxID=641309 RepID=A0A7S2X795_9EUKA|eukprot:CAMPEP_0170176328 /NCGR_PEP_ID=MMETSP0040_2-20121228/9232_1 /TAXON_ID=641309 /ORGANISM="Lotharella oceanica, Strain CCMP622" /LENGTH=318 /DNA_ID=CAMNT_0010418611 /DNA_START=38 /DNA_END=994 /DNA_ORIENTATION=+